MFRSLLGIEENWILKPEVEFENVNSIAYISNEKKTIICATIWVKAGDVNLNCWKIKELGKWDVLYGYQKLNQSLIQVT